jgi:hypothetical protein
MNESDESAVTKWADIAARRKSDHGAANCSLCMKYCYEGEDGITFCEDKKGNVCPIEQSGFCGCSESPYDEWCWHIRIHIHEGLVQCRDCQTLALIEMLFVYDCVTETNTAWRNSDDFMDGFDSRLTFKNVGADEIV